MSPPVTDRSESSAGSNSMTSKSSTPDITPSSTPAQDSYDTCKIGSRPLPALHREYPKPPQEVDVQTLLGRQPGRWTIQGQIDANSERAAKAPAAAAAAAAANEEKLRERRARDFEAAKKDLLAFHQAQPSREGQW